MKEIKTIFLKQVFSVMNIFLIVSCSSANLNQKNTNTVNNLALKPEINNKVSFKLNLNKELFSKKSKLNLTLYNNKNYSGPSIPAFDPSKDKEPSKGVDFMEGEKITLDINDSKDEILITSDKLKVGGTYKLLLEGISNDECRNIYTSISGDINNKIIELNNVKWEYFGEKCLSGEIKDENGNKINNEVNIYINGQLIKSTDGTYFKNQLHENDINIITGAKGYIPQKENFNINNISEKHNIILKRNLQNLTGITLKFDKINSILGGYNFSKRRKISISLEVNANKHNLLLDPSTKNNIEEIKFNDISIGDLYKFDISAQSEKSSCKNINYSGEGIILSDGMFPLKEAIKTIYSTSSGEACPNINTVIGKITDKQGNLITGVKVKIKPTKFDESDLLPWEEEIVSTDGTYQFKNIPSGMVTISISKDGWKNLSRTELLRSPTNEKENLIINFTENYSIEKL